MFVTVSQDNSRKWATKTLYTEIKWIHNQTYKAQTPKKNPKADLRNCSPLKLLRGSDILAAKAIKNSKN